MSVATKLAVPAIVVGAILSTVDVDAASPDALADVYRQYVNGCAGGAEAEATRAPAWIYPLELVFTRRSENREEAVANVHVQIRDGQDRLVLDKAAQGPVLVAQLPDGPYTIVAEFRGETKTQRVSLTEGRLEKVALVWS